MNTVRLPLLGVVVAIDESIFLDLIDELAELAARGGHPEAGAALTERAASYRGEGNCSRSVLSTRRCDVLGATGILAMLDIGLPSAADQTRAETIVDEIWVGSVTIRSADAR